MSKVTENQEVYMRRTIRDAMAIDPLISQRELLAIIEKKYNRKMSFHYLIRLIRKVNGERQIRYGPEEAKRVIVTLRETVRVLRAEAFRIAYPPETQLDKPSHGDRLRGLELIAKLEKQQAVLEASFRVYNTPDGKEDILKGEDLIGEADEQIREIARTMQSWHFMPPGTRKIEAREAPVAETTHITNDAPKQQPQATEPQPAVLPSGQKLIHPKLAPGSFTVGE